MDLINENLSQQIILSIEIRADSKDVCVSTTDCSFVMWNPIFIIKGNSKLVPFNQEFIKPLCGAIIYRVEIEDEDCIKFFTSSIKFFMSLRPCDYSGSEAMQLNGRKGEIIVID